MRRTNAVTTGAADDCPFTKATSGRLVETWAMTPSGQAVAPPNSVMNSRRLMGSLPDLSSKLRLPQEACVVRHSKIGRPTSGVGQSRPMRSGSHDRACPLRLSKRTICTPSQQVRSVPVNAGLSPVRKRFHQFANGLEEHLRDRAKRPILQGGDADRLSNGGQLHGQCFKSGMFTRQEEREADDHSEETLRREQLVAQNDGGSRHGKPRRIKTSRAKHPRLHRAEISVGRIQHPRLAQQLVKLDLAAVR